MEIELPTGGKVEVHYNKRKWGKFHEIKEYAEKNGLQLVAPTSEDENQAIAELAKKQNWKLQ